MQLAQAKLMIPVCRHNTWLKATSKAAGREKQKGPRRLLTAPALQLHPQLVAELPFVWPKRMSPLRTWRSWALSSCLPRPMRPRLSRFSQADGGDTWNWNDWRWVGMDSAGKALTGETARTTSQCRTFLVGHLVCCAWKTGQRDLR